MQCCDGRAGYGCRDADARHAICRERINNELARLGFDEIPDVAGNEPLFARTIFESLALRYASATANLEKMLGRKLERIHMIGGATRNKLLVELTEQRTGLKVEIGETESSTVGNLAVQLAASEAAGDRVTPAAIREWAKRLCRDKSVLEATSAHFAPGNFSMCSSPLRPK